MKNKNKLDAKLNTQQLIVSEQSKAEKPIDKKKLEKLEKERLKALKKGKTLCQVCNKKCSGEVLRVQDKYFHTQCFKCKACGNSLAQGGFFSKDGAYYCTADYQRNFGTKCSACGDYVEGEVATVLGKTYHQKCFTCHRCRQPFPSGEKATLTANKEVLCTKCVQIPIRDATPKTSPTNHSANDDLTKCAGCRDELKEGQALVALDQQWHIWCFKCGSCGTVLHGEYMGRDGVPYCERDYQKQFGVKCAYCNRFISGKVLQAGDNHHFHPTCARCTKCGDPFGDGEEMYLQGGAIWHPRCGPGPTENGQILNGSAENGNCTDTDVSVRDFDRHSTSGASEMQFSMRSRTPSLNGSLYSPTSMIRKHYSYRTPSPGLILREPKSATLTDDISRIYTYSYLTEEPTQGYLRRPIDPYDKTPVSPHFHRPTSQNSLRGSQGAGGKRFGSRSAMKILVDSIRSETPRPKSPHMNNEEPIELAHFPGAKPPKPGEEPKIERDDFPAPPYPYTDPERRKRWSDSYKGVSADSDEDEVDGKTAKEIEDEKLKREEEELSKIASGIGKVFLKNVQEREKVKKIKAAHLDPRNASRTPSANKEPAYRLRYDNPIGASPSRNLDHQRPFDDEEFDRSMSCRSSMGRSIGQIPNYNVSSLRSVPKPGYGLKSSTLPSRNGYGDYSFSGMGAKTHSTDFSCGKSDISTGSITDVERRGLNSDMPVSSTYTGGLGRYPGGGYSSQVRRSLPNMAHSMLINEPAKIYPYHLLLITNYRLPADVDRCNLERHLSDQEFEGIFQIARPDFYRLPAWRRNELKRRARLF
ncbi:actin-binding LIM protein 3 isoform X3 [Aethina tumida]|uniref:actin-binding LIM protein 3 isoform X3 n=1 Tax=Aethina tumida TaxID=116153 RepID=UPI00214979AF|nr:actin-binding LIM protein 3 isoform X3 [Aethina tumida]